MGMATYLSTGESNTECYIVSLMGGVYQGTNINNNSQKNKKMYLYGIFVCVKMDKNSLC